MQIVKKFSLGDYVSLRERSRAKLQFYEARDEALGLNCQSYLEIRSLLI